MAFIDQTKIFYGVSAFLGVLAISYFGFEYLVALSPFTISVMLFSIFFVFLAIGLRRDGNTSVLSYVFSAASYVIALFYTLAKFAFSTDQTMLSLAASSAFFAGLGCLITQKEFEPDMHQLKIGFTILVLLVGGLVVYDNISGDVEHSYDLVSEVEPSQTVVVGEAAVWKRSWLPRESSTVNIHTCVYNNTGERPRRAYEYSEPVNTMMFGPLNKSRNIEIDLNAEDLDIEEALPVEKTEPGERCPDSVDGPKLVVDTGSTNSVLRRQQFSD